MNNNDTLNIHLSKNFPVSRDTLYKAWTNPEELHQWWKPLGKQLSEVKNEIREGGTVQYIFEDGHLQINGIYKEVKEKEKLVYTWNWDLPEEAIHRGEYLLTIVFKDNVQSSQLDIRQENFREAHSIQPHRQGWEEALEDLENYLQNK
jgi:uncharacterized protein YndB with AHSA1/START domain